MIIVIGASGFIGTYLVDDLIKQGYDVFATGRNPVIMDHYKKNNINCCDLDISKKETFNRLPTKNIEAVILLAALLPANVSRYNPFDYIDINISGTLNVLEFCSANNIKKLISTTSYSDVCNHWEKDKLIDPDIYRDYVLKGDHAVYTISKNAATDLIIHYNNDYGFQGSVFRLPPVYGYGPHSEIYVDGKYYKSGLQIFIEKAIAGLPIEIFGDKEISRDVVYVKDVTNAFMRAIKSETSKGIYNISSGMALTLERQVKDIIDVFCGENGKSKIIFSPDKPNSGRSYVFDISKGTKDFGYVPSYIPFKKMLLDYKKEMDSKRFEYMLTARKKNK
ncbi:MAG: NAD(P)-dependent oxidoreductase [Prolixibacteraceae bacterium]